MHRGSAGYRVTYISALSILPKQERGNKGISQPSLGTSLSSNDFTRLHAVSRGFSEPKPKQIMTLSFGLWFTGSHHITRYTKNMTPINKKIQKLFQLRIIFNVDEWLW